MRKVIVLLGLLLVLCLFCMSASSAAYVAENGNSIARITDMYSEDSVLFVFLEYKNTDSKEVSFFNAFNEKAFQAGVKCKCFYGRNTMNAIKDGGSISIEYRLQMNDTINIVEFSLLEGWGTKNLLTVYFNPETQLWGTKEEAFASPSPSPEPTATIAPDNSTIKFMGINWLASPDIVKQYVPSGNIKNILQDEVVEKEWNAFYGMPSDYYDVNTKNIKQYVLCLEMKDYLVAGHEVDLITFWFLPTKNEQGKLGKPYRLMRAQYYFSDGDNWRQYPYKEIYGELKTKMTYLYGNPTVEGENSDFYVDYSTVWIADDGTAVSLDLEKGILFDEHKTIDIVYGLADDKAYITEVVNATSEYETNNDNYDGL